MFGVLSCTCEAITSEVDAGGSGVGELEGRDGIGLVACLESALLHLAKGAAL